MKSDIELYVSEEDLIGNIQKDFSFYYPYLRLQFFKNPHGEKEASLKKELLPAYLPVSEIALFHKAGRINISPYRKATEMENDFYFKLGLNVQVFRKANNIWLETTKTDDLTLKAQNEIGKISCQTVPAEAAMEFDLQDVE